MTWTEPFVNLCLSMFYTAGVKHVWHHRVGDQESGRKWPIRACTQKAEKSAHYLIDSYVYKYIQRCAQDTRRYFECLLILCLLQMFSTFSNLDLLNHQWAVFYQWLSSQVFWRAMNHLLFPQKTERIELYLAAEIIHVLDTEGLFLHIHPTASANFLKDSKYFKQEFTRSTCEEVVIRVWLVHAEEHFYCGTHHTHSGLQLVVFWLYSYRTGGLLSANVIIKCESLLNMNHLSQFFARLTHLIVDWLQNDATVYSNFFSHFLIEFER